MKRLTYPAARMAGRTAVVITAFALSSAGALTAAQAGTARPAIPPMAEITWNGSDGNLWTYDTASHDYTTLPLATGSSPSIAQLSGGFDEYAYTGSNGDLWSGAWATPPPSVADNVVAPAAGTQVRVAAGPSGNAYAIAVTTAGSKMEVLSYNPATGYTGAWLFGVSSALSPGVAAVGNGFDVAYRDTLGNLDIYSTATQSFTYTNYSMDSASGGGPSIAAVTGGYVVAYQGPNGSLQTWSSVTGFANTKQAMTTGRSPAIAGQGSGYEIAFPSSVNSDLWTYSSATGKTDTGQGIYPGTNPAITALGSGWEIAFAGSHDNLSTLNSAGTVAHLGLAMTAGTSPSLTT